MPDLAEAESALWSGELGPAELADDSPRAGWLRAVALGAAGHYGAAWSILDPLIALPASDDTSLCASAAASFHRQLGRHTAGSVLDEYALSSARSAEARADALIGLAADAVGVADLPTASRRLSQAASLGDAGWRASVRLGWVRAEVALLSGDARGGRAPAQEAAALARSEGALRHLAKSLLFVAVTSGEVRSGREGLELAEEIGALTLVWPARSILAALEPDRSGQHLRAAADVIEQIAARTPARIRASWLASADVDRIFKGAA